ncbi:MAG: hypothetical protein AMXMBFR55_14100 [Gemmatimonadota bacterium]
MPTDGHRAARAAFDAARAPFDRLTRATDPRELATALVAVWTETERALRALAGTTALGGVAVVRELRQRNLLALDDAHAFVDLHAAAERARGDGYAPTSADVDAARAAFDRMAQVLSRDMGSGASGDVRFTGPVATAPAAPSESLPPPPPPPLPASARSNTFAIAVVALVALAVVGAGAYYALAFSRESSALRDGRAAYAAGDRLTARNAFAAATRDAPGLAEPHLFLGRMAREDGDVRTASAELRRAVELEPANYLTHRELAAFLLATGQPELARSFYQRAIELNPSDKVSLGYMACTLLRLGRGDLAVRFFERAGPGAWQACQAAPPPGAMTPPAAPR